jgi:choline dehydrogenase-like flavoprotein
VAEEHVEFLVIGSGAGGAFLTQALVTAGRQVLMLEKGPLLRTQYQSPDGLSDFKRDETFATGSEKRITIPGMANTGESFFASHVEPDLNDEPHIYRSDDGRDRVTIEGYTAQVVGGGTQLYGGVSLRFTPDDLRLASFNAGRADLRDDPNGDVEREARDWPISYEVLEPYYCKAEELVGLTERGTGRRSPPRLTTTSRRSIPTRSVSMPRPGWTRSGCGATGRRRR